MGRPSELQAAKGDSLPIPHGASANPGVTSPQSLRALNTDHLGHVAIVLPGLSAGGTERAVSLIANHWVERGHPVTLITLEAKRSVPYYELDKKVRIINLDLSPRQAVAPYAAWLTIRRVLHLRKTLKRISPDVILSFLMRTNVMVLLAVVGTRMPVVVSERNNPALQPLGAVWQKLRSLMYPRAFGLVTMTRGAMSYFPPSMRQRGWIIPNTTTVPAGRRKSHRGKRLVAVGRLVRQKGFDLLIDAYAIAVRQYPDWTLTIWGEGPERAALEKRRDAHGLQGRVVMPGVSKTPGSWLESADAFVLSSRFEGWGIVLLEAMTWGLPCVSFDCEWGPREMIANGVNGILVENGNVDALAAELSRLMGDETLRKSLSKAARSSTRKFASEVVMAKWDEVVDTVLLHKDFARRVPK